MHSIPLGPLALPTAPVLLLLALGLASWWAGRLAGPTHRPALGSTIQTALMVGLLAARITHLALHARAYGPDPLAWLDIRDGGWHAGAGWTVGLAWLAWRAAAQDAWRRPLAIGTTLALLIWGAGQFALHRATDRGMPTLTLRNLASGAEATLAQAAGGRPVVVNLWASWCGPCRQEMPMLAQAQRTHADIGFVFVNQGESPEAIQAYLRDQDLPLREVWLDRDARFGPAVGSRGLPTTLFYDASGRLTHLHFGVLNAAALQVQLAALRGKG